MPKKKKKMIVHLIRRFDLSYLCGQKSGRTLYEDLGDSRINSFLENDGCRLCNKCKYIHKHQTPASK